ncbi:MAG: nucleotide pyrophosphohydrolase [Erysipelotrichia bacterium]|jgi:NTP pyrophosphatase (non-canonical NTP hydrolase)|nr:nucleotide pyrophosphohydrolase [Erysipelotrichia bacterium]
MKECSQEITMEKLMQIIDEFCKERDWDQYHSPKELAIGLSTEANELLALFRFQSDEQIRAMFENQREMIEDEIVDSLFFILRFASLYDVDLLAALERKMIMNRKKYPVDLARGKNIKYTHLK